MATRKHLLCEGTGFYPVGSQTIDTICGGTGVVPLETCKTCDGTGFYPLGSETPCYSCDGRGFSTLRPVRLGTNHFYSHEVLDCLVDAEYIALQEAKKDGVRIILSMGIVDLSEGSASRTKLFNFFPTGTTTRTNLESLLEES